ncbi:hypothetical protein JB92DRAFT_1391395 [Gautieria morchelliformis]|nr:hypothetical protein JB92DRAFT_1391395 [Gautieria morchelliformis]
MSSVIGHSPADSDTSRHGKDGNMDANTEAVVWRNCSISYFRYHPAAFTKCRAFARAKRINPSERLNPSPSKPSLGKCTRGPVETPDISVTKHGQQQHEGAELAALHRVTRPLKKQRRLDLDYEEDAKRHPIVSVVLRGKNSKVDADTEAVVGSGVAAPPKLLIPPSFLILRCRSLHSANGLAVFWIPLMSASMKMAPSNRTKGLSSQLSIV